MFCAKQHYAKRGPFPISIWSYNVEVKTRIYFTYYVFIIEPISNFNLLSNSMSIHIKTILENTTVSLE